MVHRSALPILLLLLATPWGLASAQPVLLSENESFALALRAYEEGQFVAAADRFERFDQDFPASSLLPEALFYRGNALLAANMDQQAVAALAAFESRYPAHPRAYEARLALGRYYFETRQAALAIETLETVVSTRNPPPELAARALYWMGDAAMQLNDAEAALQYYYRSSQLTGTEAAPAALYARGYTFIGLKRYDEGAQAFETLANRYPDSEFSLSVGLALAEVYYETGDYLRTVSEIKQRLPRLDPGLVDKANFLLAESYNQLRDSQNAIVHYQHFTEASPGNPYYRRARMGLGWNYHYEQAYQWAAEEFAKVRDGSGDELDQAAVYYEAVNLKLSAKPAEAASRFLLYADSFPDGPLADHALFELGVLRYAMRDWDTAGDVFSRLIRSYPASPLLGEAYMHRGNVLIAQGDFDGALLAFDQAIRRNAAAPRLRDEVVFQKAWLLYRRGAYEQSAKAFGELLAQNPTGEKADESLFWAGESEFQLNRFDAAGDKFRRYLRDYPNGKQAEAVRYALGWTYFRQARYGDAIPQFQAFLRVHQGGTETIPYEADARLRLADSHFALKQYGDAIRVYGRLVADGDDYSLYQIGQAYANAGDPLEAIASFRRLLEIYPQSEWREEARYQLGYLFFLNQEYDAAISTFQDLIRAHGADPLAAKAQYGIGDAYFNAGKQDQAIAAYQVVLQRYPNSAFAADAARGIQFALVAAGEDDRSVALIDSFAAANPDSPLVDELRFRRAEVLYQSGQPDAALNDLLTFVRSAKDARLLSEAYFYLGTIYADRGNDREAESYLSQILTRYPDSDRRSEAALRLGKIYLSTNRPEKANEAFAQASGGAAGTAPNAEGLYGQSMALMAQGRVEEAEQLLQALVERAPDDPASMPAYLGLGRIYEQRGFRDRARNYYRQAASGSRGEAGAEALFRIGSMLRKSGDPRGAIAELDRLSSLFAGYDEWMAQGYMEQARAFEQIGDRGEAVKMYDNVIDFYPDRPEAATARQEKNRITGGQN